MCNELQVILNDQLNFVLVYSHTTTYIQIICYSGSEFLCMRPSLSINMQSNWIINYTVWNTAAMSTLFKLENMQYAFGLPPHLLQDIQ